MKLVLTLLALLYLFAIPAFAVGVTIFDPVVSGDELSVIASVSATKSYYLQGRIKSVGGVYYFGSTKNNLGEWVEYVGSPEKDYVVSSFYKTDPSVASNSARLEMQFDPLSTLYTGPGEYELQVRAFTGGSSSSAGDSVPLTITLTYPTPTPIPSPVPTPTPTLSPYPSPSPTPTLTTTGSPSPLPSLSPSLLVLPSARIEEVEEGTVAGVTDIDLSAFATSPSPLSSPSQEASGYVAGPSLNTQRLKVVILVGLGILLVTIGGYLIFRRHLKSKHVQSNS